MSNEGPTLSREMHATPERLCRELGGTVDEEAVDASTTESSTRVLYWVISMQAISKLRSFTPGLPRASHPYNVLLST